MLTYKELTLDDLDTITESYIDSFNSEPWNDEWTNSTARKRLHAMINTEDFFGLIAYQDEQLVGVILGNYEQYYDGIIFNLKEFWVVNELRGKGIGTHLLQELERQVKQKDVLRIVLLTIRALHTVHFYSNHGYIEEDQMVFMRKIL